MDIEIQTMSLPVKLTETDLALRAQELATAESVLAEHESQLLRALESAKGTKKKLENEIFDARHVVGRLARVVRERHEDREVPIMETSDYELGAINTCRTDTGEVVATRGMSQEERQQSLFDRNRKSS